MRQPGSEGGNSKGAIDINGFGAGVQVGLASQGNGVGRRAEVSWPVAGGWATELLQAKRRKDEERGVGRRKKKAR